MSPFCTCTVYCGSTFGARHAYREASETLGKLLAERSITLVYGGGKVGLMGTVADAALGASGMVVGVIPRFMIDLELAHLGCTKLHIVEDMRTRKRMMLELADAFIAMPGGIGTLEELVEALEWTCAGRHTKPKPVALLNLDGIFTPFVKLLRDAIDEGFEPHSCLRHLVIAETPQALIVAIDQYFDDAHNVSSFGELAVDIRSVTIEMHSKGGKTNSGDAVGVLVDDKPYVHIREDYKVAAHHFGRALAAERFEVVIGNGGPPGSLASVVSDGAVRGGGNVTGIVQSSRDVALKGVVWVKSLAETHLEHPCHARKRSLLERCDRIVALPGGLAVWDEFLEVLCGALLQRHSRAIGLLNIQNFYDPLLQLLNKTIECGFIHHDVLTYVVTAATPEELLSQLRTYNPTRIIKIAKPNARL